MKKAEIVLKYSLQNLVGILGVTKYCFSIEALNSNPTDLLLRFLLSAIFVLSAWGKVADRAISALSLSQLSGLPIIVSEFIILLWSGIEGLLAIVIWFPRLSRLILIIPLLLFIVAFFGYWQGIDCGGFGSLPLLNQFSFDRTAVGAAIANHSAVIIDARPDFQYELGHLPGAINIPYDSGNLVELVNKHSLKNQAIILYCSSAHCNAAEPLAEKLRVLGCEKVRLYPGGWEEWVSGGESDRVK